MRSSIFYVQQVYSGCGIPKDLGVKSYLRDTQSMSDDQAISAPFNKYVGTAEDADAFKQRLIKKDHDRTRKRSGIDAAIIDEDRARLHNLSGESRLKSLSALREQSRQKYLAKREESELRKLELKIFDEERLFKGEELSADERRRLEIDKELLRIAKKRRKLRHEENGYFIPGGEEDTSINELVTRDREESGKKNIENDPDLFLPKDGLGGSKSETGVPAQASADKEYELLLNEEHIQFVSDSKKRKKKKKEKKNGFKWELI